jgi:hypothetical protein
VSPCVIGNPRRHFRRGADPVPPPTPTPQRGRASARTRPFGFMPDRESIATLIASSSSAWTSLSFLDMSSSGHGVCRASRRPPDHAQPASLGTWPSRLPARTGANPALCPDEYPTLRVTVPPERARQHHPNGGSHRHACDTDRLSRGRSGLPLSRRTLILMIEAASCPHDRVIKRRDGVARRSVLHGCARDARFSTSMYDSMPECARRTTTGRSAYIYFSGCLPFCGRGNRRGQSRNCLPARIGGQGTPGGDR